MPDDTERRLHARPRRVHRRLDHRVTVAIGPPGGVLRPAVTGNVSISGLYLEAPGAEIPGARLDVEVVPGDGERFRLQGVVVWAAEADEAREGFGVWLLDPPAAWRRYCSALVGGAPPVLTDAEED